LLQGATEMGTTAAGKLIELIEHPKTTLRETYVIEGNVLIGESVKDINSKRKNV